MKLPKSPRMIALWSAACIFCCAHITASGEDTRWQGSSDIVFSGTSTLHKWSGLVSARSFIAIVQMDEQGKPTHITAKVEIAAAKMDTAEPKRDENMHKAMHVSDFPLISGMIDVPYAEVLAGRKEPSKVPFTLTLLGKKHTVTANVIRWVVEKDSVNLTMEFDLSMKECGIEVPSVALVIRVGDTVKVHVPVKLVKTPAAKEEKK